MIRSLALAAALVLPLATAASAAPTVQTFGGQTTVRLSEEFLAALALLEADAAAVKPARLKGNKASFPIPGSVIDAGQTRGDIFHLGGLTIGAGGTEVGLLNFLIDLTGPTVLTGLVTVNNDLIDRVPLFDLELTQEPEIKRGGILVVRGVLVELTAAAADALNDIFDLDGFFEAGFPIGVAKVVTRIVDTSGGRGDDDDDDDDRHPDDD